jgi:hypothetical protein
MQNTITITELLRNHKAVQVMVNNSSEPIAVISNSKIVFEISKPVRNTQTKNIRTRFQGKIKGKISREEIYNKSWLDK